MFPNDSNTNQNEPAATQWGPAALYGPHNVCQWDHIRIGGGIHDPPPGAPARDRPGCPRTAGTPAASRATSPHGKGKEVALPLSPRRARTGLVQLSPGPHPRAPPASPRRRRGAAARAPPVHDSLPPAPRGPAPPWRAVPPWLCGRPSSRRRLSPLPHRVAIRRCSASISAAGAEKSRWSSPRRRRSEALDWSPRHA